MIKKIINKYKKMPVTIKASFWFIICGFLQRGISVITTPIFSRLLTPEEFGVYSVFSSWLEIFTILFTFKIAVGSYTQGMIKYDNNKEKYTSSLVGLSSIMIFVWFCIYIIFHKYINELLGLTTFMMICMFIMIWSACMFEFWSAKKKISYDYKALVILIVFTSILKPLISIIFIMCTENYKAEARIFGLTLVELLSFMGLFFILMKQGKLVYNKEYWKYAINYNLPLLPHYLSTFVLSHSDRIMIVNMIGNSAAGKYSLTYNIASMIRVFNVSLNNVLLPWTYQKIKEKQYEKIGDYGMLIMYAVAIINMIMMLFAPEIMILFSPASYRDAVWCIYPISMSMVFIFMYDTFSKFAMYFEKTKFVMYVSVICAILNLILNFLLIPVFGYIAAAYTTLICYIIFALGHYLSMKYTCKINNIRCPYSLKKICVFSLMFVLLSFCIMALTKYNIIRYTIFGLILIIIFFNKERLISFFRILKIK